MISLTICRLWTVRLGRVAVLACAAGCQDSLESSAGARGTFSDVYSRFDPIAEFARLGWAVRVAPATGAISVTDLHGWKSKQGSLELPANVAGCEAVAAAIQSSLNQVPGVESVDDFRDNTLFRDWQRGQLLHGVLRYTADGMHGHVYFWLFPDASESKINFAILLQEDRRGDSRGTSARLELAALEKQLAN